MKKGTATIYPKKGKYIDIRQVPKAIKNAGFTPGIIKIAVTGVIKVDKEQQLILQVKETEQKFLLTDLKDATKEWMLLHAGAGTLVELVGFTRERRAV